MLGIMREDAKPFDENEHPRGKGGKFVSKNGGERVSEAPQPQEHIPVKKLKAIQLNLERRLVGKKTTDGRVIKAIGDHLVLQCARREVHPTSVVNAVFNGKRRKDIERHGRFAYAYRGTVVILTPEGNLMNVIYTGKK